MFSLASAVGIGNGFKISLSVNKYTWSSLFSTTFCPRDGFIRLFTHRFSSRALVKEVVSRSRRLSAGMKATRSLLPVSRILVLSEKDI